MLNKQGERALVYLANVDSIEPITFLNAEGELEEASAIEKLTTGGWNLVVQKGRFEVDQLFVYAECDTILPADVELFAFLEGKRVRTKKLKGVISQGVAFTIPEILDVVDNRIDSLYTIEDGARAYNRAYNDYQDLKSKEWEIGEDITELIGATKYDEYSNNGNNGRKSDGVKLPPAHAKGNFPSFILKTDEERIQNLAKELKYDWQGKEVVITEKLDGSSITIYCKYQENLIAEDENEIKGGYLIGICSRNLDLKLEDITNHFVKTGSPYLDSLITYCKENSRSLALQGEIIGPGIQGNPYKLDKHEIYFFNVFDIDAGRKLAHQPAVDIMRELGVNKVPLVGFGELDKSMEQMLEIADGLSTLNSKTNREGIVVRALDGSFSFKVISNKWLLKEKE